MTPLDFLKIVWPPADDKSVYCIALSLPKGMKHRVFDTIETAAKFVESVKTTENVFFATHVLRQPQVWNLRKYKDNLTGDWVAGWSVRTQKNMRYALSFFFDLDVKPDDPSKYPDQQTAILALKAFVKTYNLPRPMVVNSGGGVHVYWVIDRPLPSSTEWVTLATRLRQLAQHHGLKVDPTRTTDTASVLRVAGTLNLKGGLQRPVDALNAAPEVVSPETWELRLTKALDSVDVVPAAAKVEAMPTPDDDDVSFGSNIGPKVLEVKNPPKPETMFETCAQLARIKALNGNLREPEWYSAMGALQFAVNGRQACHDISKGHRLYTPAYVDAKIDQWKWGATTCAKLNLESGPENNQLCAACPHVAKNMGPLSLAKNMEKAPPPVIEELVDGVKTTREIPDPPMPYKRTADGRIEVLVDNPKTGGQFPEEVHPYDLYPLDRTVDHAAETETQIWRAHLPHDVVKDFTITASDFVDKGALAARLANNGVYSIKFDKLRSYMSVYIQELQKRNVVNIEHDYFGWTKKKDEFVLPHGVVKADGSIVPVNLGSMAKSVGTFGGKAGTIERQIELLRFYDDPRYVGQQFMVMCGLASALFFPTGHAGTVVNGSGDSGASKSSTLAAAASFWGNPMSYVLNGTKAGMTHMAGGTTTFALSTLPYIVDELTRLDAERIKDIAFEHSQSEPRKRSGREGKLLKPQETNKSNIMISSSNTSLQALLAVNNNAGQAGAVRVFEIILEKCEFLGVHEKWEADEFLREIKQNYGHIGEYFIRKIMPHREAIERRVIAVMKDIEIAGKMKADERFWSAVCAAVLTTLEIARRLGLVNYDYNFMRNWLLTVQLPKMRGVVKEETSAISPLVVLTNYMDQINNSIIRLDAGNTLHVPHGPMLGHYNIATTEMVLLKEGFREYCDRRKLPSQAILRTLLGDGVVTSFDKQFTLGSGTDHAKGRAMCFIVDMAHPAIARVPVPQTIPPNITPLGSAPSNVVPLRPQGANKK